VTTLRLPASAFRVLTDHLKVRVPAVIDIQPAAFHPDDRRAEAAGILADLRRSGLVDAHDEVDETLAGRLRILGQAQQIVDVVAHIDGPVNAVLAASARRAVLVIQNGHQIAVRRARPLGLGEQAARLLPDRPAGYGRSVSLPTKALKKAAAEAGEDGKALETALQRNGVRRDDAHMIAVMNQAPVHTAQFGVTVNGNRGEHVLGWWCTESGGYLTEELPSTSGEPWTTLAPADLPRIATQIDRLVSR
jgi:hypothetical protein